MSIETTPYLPNNSHQGLDKIGKHLIQPNNEWNWNQKLVFRTAFVFILLLCIPLNKRFYNNIIEMDWGNFYWSNLSSIASGLGAQEFVAITNENAWGWESYVNLVLTLLVSVSASGVWGILDRHRKEYNTLYFWIRVLARYRLAFGVIAWGYKKLIPIQMELPSESFLNTPFGDFREQKLYWQSVGITQNYEIFLGFAEVLAGALLLFRKTTALGAAFTVVLMINIVIANHAYDGGVHVHSFTYALLGFILLWYDFPRIWKLLVREQAVAPTHTYPSFFLDWQKYARLGLKTVGVGIFVFYLLYLHWIDDRGYRFPPTLGLKNAIGAYHVTEFKLNNKIIPYSPIDSVRWQDAIFERWSTLTFRVNRKQQMDMDNNKGERKSIDMRFEFSGIGGGRHFFHYDADTVNHILYLQNKNKTHRDQQQTLHYTRPSDTRIILDGVNEFKDSIHVVLDKADNSYPLYDGRQKATLY